MTQSIHLDISLLADLDAFAQTCVQTCPEGAWVFLHGDLGAGKTTFAQHFLRAKGYQGMVTSPTYALMNEYCMPTGRVVHCDLYRLADPEELYEIGLLDLPKSTIKLVEWAEKGQGVLPNADVDIFFDLKKNGARMITVNYPTL